MNASRRELLKFALAGGLMSTGLARYVLGQTTATAPTTSPANPYADAVFEAGPPPLPADDAFTVAVMPDTQHYAQKYPNLFHVQTQWIADQAKSRRIAAVLHLGDVTNRNTPDQWQVAREAMARLDGHVPYFVCPGNHDYGADGKATDRTTGFTDSFPLATFKDRPTFGGVYDREPERTENTYHLFSAGGREFLVLCLEFGPRKDVVRWANEIAAKYAKREAILITHAYVYYNSTRYDWKKYGTRQRWNPHGYPVARNTNDDVSDGQELWENLVSKHENFILTLNGHVLGSGLGFLTDKTPTGREVAQSLVNFQMKPNGGDGWLRLLEFKPDHTIEVRDYSPTLDKQNAAKTNRFTIHAAKVG